MNPVHSQSNFSSIFRHFNRPNISGPRFPAGSSDDAECSDDHDAIQIDGRKQQLIQHFLPSFLPPEAVACRKGVKGWKVLREAAERVLQGDGGKYLLLHEYACRGTVVLKYFCMNMI